MIINKEMIMIMIIWKMIINNSVKRIEDQYNNNKIDKTQHTKEENTLEEKIIKKN